MITFHVGYDQAFANTGRAILKWDSDTKKAEYIESVLFHPSIKMGHKSDAIAFLEHLAFIKKDLTKVKSMGPIGSITMEGVAIGAPGQASARGGIFGIYATACLSYADLIIVSPKKLKSFITGDGKAEKEQIAEVLFKKYSIAEKDIETFDETDAIALADVGLYAWRYMQEGEESLKNELTELQQEIIWGREPVKKKHKSSPQKYFGICNRIDDFYIFKRGKK